jgi:hypothetical protein
MIRSNCDCLYDMVHSTVTYRRIDGDITGTGYCLRLQPSSARDPISSRSNSELESSLLESKILEDPWMDEKYGFVT